MRVAIFDWCGDEKRFRCNANLTDCFPDDPEGLADARQQLLDHGEAHIGIGGGGLTTLELRGRGEP